MKQALIEGADRLPNVRAAEQGAGKINLARSAAILKSYAPRLSAFPAVLNLTDCPYMWPHCEQPLFARGAPLMLNVTLLNGMGPTGRVVGSPTFTMSASGGGAGGGGNDGGGPPPPPPLEVRFEHSERLYPWSGHLAVFVHVADSPAARRFDGVVQGEIEVVGRVAEGGGRGRRTGGARARRALVSSSPPPEARRRATSTVTIPLVARVVPTPPRASAPLGPAPLGAVPSVVPAAGLAVGEARRAGLAR